MFLFFTKSFPRNEYTNTRKCSFNNQITAIKVIYVLQDFFLLSKSVSHKLLRKKNLCMSGRIRYLNQFISQTGWDFNLAGLITNKTHFMTMIHRDINLAMPFQESRYTHSSSYNLPTYFKLMVIYFIIWVITSFHFV